MNIYYNPEKFNLKIVESFEYSSGCYEFDTRVIWQNLETGKLYTYRDSGCSCPTPFESVGISDLEPFNAEILISEAKEQASSGYSGDSLIDVIEKIRRLS